MGPTNSKLSYQNLSLSLSLSLSMVVVVNRWERSMAMLTGSGLLLAVVVFLVDWFVEMDMVVICFKAYVMVNLRCLGGEFAEI